MHGPDGVAEAGDLVDDRGQEEPLVTDDDVDDGAVAGVVRGLCVGVVNVNLRRFAVEALGNTEVVVEGGREHFWAVHLEIAFGDIRVIRADKGS